MCMWYVCACMLACDMRACVCVCVCVCVKCVVRVRFCSYLRVQRHGCILQKYVGHLDASRERDWFLFLNLLFARRKCIGRALYFGCFWQRVFLEAYCTVQRQVLVLKKRYLSMSS